MSFGGFGSTGFGANTQASPFGGGGQSQFGQQQPAQPTPFGGGGFGQQPQGSSTPFGGGQSTFGAPAAPAGGGFGASQGGGFGQPSGSTPFGGSAFGAKPATSSFGGFGQSSAPATSSFGSAPAVGGFGAPASTGFGQQPQTSTPFGGAAGGFGSTTTTTTTTPFGGASSSFGQPQAQPAFGSTTTTTTGFGSGGGTFASGGTGGAFGQPAGGMQTARGTSGAAWRKTQEIDQSSTGTRTTVYFNSITCMPEYVTKSVEELRWEDYEAGNKGGQQAGAVGQTGGMFGSQPAASTPFGGATQSPTSGAFGAPAQTSFGAPSTSSFGGGGTFGSAASAPAFGASSSPAFGAAPTTAFGGGGAFGATSTPAFGAPSSTPAFGATSAPAFGAPSSTPAFGATTAAPTSAFGGSGFGAPASTPAFGAAASTPAFGAPSSTPAFGAPGSAPAFGSSTPALGGGSAFGGASSTPAFGASTTPAFGAAPASTPAFSFGGAAATPKPASFQFNSPAPATSTFGATPGFGGMSTPSFGAANSTPAFGGGGGLFGSTPGPSTSQPAGQTFGGMGTSGLFGSSQQGAAGAQQGGAAMGAASPYGNMPDAPKVTPLPEYKLGLTQRILAPPSAGPPKPIALITPRSLTPHGGGKIRPRVSATATRMSKSPADFFASSTLHRTPGTKAVTPGGDGGLFVPRDDPRRLLIREELPLSSNAKSKATGRTPTSGPAVAPCAGRSNGTPTAPNGLGDVFNGMPSSASPLTLKSLSPPNSKKDNLAILPRLEREGYTLEPSMKQLGAMAMDDPDSLAYVANVTVRKEGVGSVRWLDPVDLRNLDIDSIVVLAQGSVDVYPDDSEKPPVGRGLNCPAVITLNGVYKMDKATGKPTKDPELVEKYSRKLKSICARDSAKFISYDGETGVWKFEVEHFSRYGLDGSSDDEGDEIDDINDVADNGGDEQHGAKKGVIPGKDLADPPAAPSLRDLGDSSQSDFSELSEDSTDMQLGIKGRHPRPEVTVDVEVPARARGLVSPRWGTSAHTPTGFAGRTLPSPIGLHRQLQGDDETFEDTKMDDDDFAPISNWKLPGIGDADGLPRGLAPAILPSKDRSSSHGPANLAHQVAVDTRNLADYGALMHNAFRVGWSRGRVVAPPRTPIGCVTLTNPAGDTDDIETRLIVDQLKIHKENSFPVEGTPAHRSPRLQLKCGRSPELLRSLTMQYINSIDRYIERDVERDDTPAKIAQAEIWELVSVLFSLVPAEEDPIADDASDASDPGSLTALAGMQRRAKLSAWLKSVASDGIRRQIDAISGLPGKGNEEVLVRLSGHDLAGAVMAASSCGNVRLSTLLATAGSSTEAMGSIIEQLRVWKEEGYVEHIDQEMMEIYELLAGNVDSAMYIVAEDWKRSLGMHLWYARPNMVPISEAVEGYLAAVQAGNAPYPGPWHPVKPTPDAKRPTDTAFELIRMFCFSEEWESEGEKATASLGALPDLLCPLGTTPDVQRVDFYWHLQCVLEAIGVIPEVKMYATGSAEAALSDAVSRVITSFISQLESVGGLVHWAIYVALHIMDDDYRDIVVNDLLSRYVEEWHTNETVVGFLVQELGVPVAMLEGAKALWAAHINDDEMLLDALIESNAWNEAHDVFRRKIAPTWLLAQSPSGDLGVLHESLIGASEELEQHADYIDADDWRIGGDMYLSYFRLQERLQHLDPDDVDRVSIDELGQALDDAQNAISSSSGELEKAAYAYLAQKLARTCGASWPPHGTNALRCAAAATIVSAGALELGTGYANI